MASPPRAERGIAFDTQQAHRSPRVVFLGDAESQPAIQFLLRDRQLSVQAGNCRDTDLPLVPHVDADVIFIDEAHCKTPLKRLREAWKECAPSASAVVLSASPSPATIAAAIRDGADDVVGLPCSPTDLLIRVHVAYRRARLADSGKHGHDDVKVEPTPVAQRVPIRLHLATRSLSHGGRTVLLSRRECALAELLCRSPHRAVSRHEILMAVWEREYNKTAPNNLVDVYARFLRRRFSQLGIQRALDTVRYVGYRLNSDAEVL